MVRRSCMQGMSMAARTMSNDVAFLAECSMQERGATWRCPQRCIK